MNHKFRGFVEHIRQSLYTWTTIFNNPSDVLEHIFHVLGGGYRFENGKILHLNCLTNKFNNVYSTPRLSGKALEQFEKKIIDYRTESWRGWDSGLNGKSLEEELASEHRDWVEIKKSDFDTDSLLNGIKQTSERLLARSLISWPLSYVYRPYPALDSKYIIQGIQNPDHPDWLKQILINFETAWIQFIKEEIATGHVCPNPGGKKDIQYYYSKKYSLKQLKHLRANIKWLLENKRAQ